VLSLNLELVHLEVPMAVRYWVLLLTLFELAECDYYWAEVFVLSIGIWLEEFNFDLPLDFVFAEVCGTKLYLIPLEEATFGALYLRLVNWGVFAKCNVPINDKETDTAFGKSCNRIENYDFSVCCGCLLFSGYDDATRSSHSTIPIDQRFHHGLVPWCDDFMELELQWANKIVLAQILRHLSVVVWVVNLKLVILWLLEVEVDNNFFYKLWVQIVVYHLCLANFLPEATRLFEEYHKWVWLRRIVHIGELLALKAERKLVRKPGTTKISRS